MAIFYRAVRNLVDFSLVTKLTKHVSKVRETVRKCEKCENGHEKLRRNDCETFFMTSDSQKMISRFLDSYFCTKFQISQPGWYPDQAIKIRHMEIVTFTAPWFPKICFFHHCFVPKNTHFSAGHKIQNTLMSITFASLKVKKTSLAGLKRSNSWRQ